MYIHVLAAGNTTKFSTPAWIANTTDASKTSWKHAGSGNTWSMSGRAMKLTQHGLPYPFIALVSLDGLICNHICLTIGFEAPAG